jgi:hypothetical protein
MESVALLRRAHGRPMAKCMRCGAEQRSDNLTRHLKKCKESLGEAPVRLHKRRNRCPKCKTECHSNSIRNHIAKCKVVPEPKPYCICVSGDTAIIESGTYVQISFGEYFLEGDAKRDLNKTGNLNSLAAKPRFKFIYDQDRYALVLCDSNGTVRAKEGKDGVWSVQSKIDGPYGAQWDATKWEPNNRLRAIWN